MDTATLTLIAAIALAVVVLGAAILLLSQRRRSQALRARYGAEYLAAVRETGDRRKAEADLREREKRVEAFDLRPLSPREATDFSERWRLIQAQFVDDPGMAIGRADELLSEVMETRGYPRGGFDQRATDLSVHHPTLVSDYRIAHEVALRHAEGGASTEDVRRALIHYRALFEDLLAPSPQDRRPTVEPRTFTSEEMEDERTEARADARRAADDRTTRRGRRPSDDRGAPRL